MPTVIFHMGSIRSHYGVLMPCNLKTQSWRKQSDKRVTFGKVRGMQKEIHHCVSIAGSRYGFYTVKLGAERGNCYSSCFVQ